MYCLSYKKAQSLVLTLIIDCAIDVVGCVRFGCVVNFLYFCIGEYHWTIFNIADVAVSIGVVIFIVGAFIVDS